MKLSPTHALQLSFHFFSLQADLFGRACVHSGVRLPILIAGKTQTVYPIKLPFSFR